MAPAQRCWVVRRRGVRWIVQDQQASSGRICTAGCSSAEIWSRPVVSRRTRNTAVPYFHMTEDGVQDFKTFGGEAAPMPAQMLLARQGLSRAAT